MRKLLVWDGDNSLWMGTLLHGDVPTLPLYRLNLCSSLCERGVIQSLASHNKLEDAQSALHGLGLDPYFLYPQASLTEPKPIMVRRIMDELGLTAPSDVAVIEDDTTQRSELEAALPGLLAASPDEISTLINSEFAKSIYTEEDFLRVRRFRDEAARRQAENEWPKSRIEFLHTLGLLVTIGKPTIEQWPRVVDLVERSHRFSALEHNFTEDELRTTNITVGYVADRFGEYGLSAVLGTVEVSHIVLLVVSCRLAGKGIGSALVANFINKNLHYHTSAAWQPTEYNTSIDELFKWFGFEQFSIGSCGSDNKGSNKQMIRSGDLGKAEIPPWIELREW